MAVGLVGNHIVLLLAADRQIRYLGHVLPGQPVDVLATAALPRAVWVAEIDIDTRVGCQLRMHLPALFIGQGLGLGLGLGNATLLGRKAEAFQRR